MVDELVKQFNESNDHIQVVAKYNPDMYKGLMQNLQAEAAAGNSPALVQIGWAFLDYFSNNFSYVSPQDAIDRFDKEDAGFLQDKFLPNVLELAVNSQGSQVGIPYSLSNPVLYINKDILREAGLAENGPATWQEVSEFAKTIKEKTGKYGFYMQEPADFWAQQGLIESSGAKMLTTNAEGKKEASFATEDGIEAMQLIADMVKDQTALHMSWEEGCQSFIDGNCAMLYTTIARRASVQKGAQFDVATVKSPCGKTRSAWFRQEDASWLLRLRAMTRLRRHGNLKSSSTAWSPWQPGQREPVMCLPERMWPGLRTGLRHSWQRTR